MLAIGQPGERFSWENAAATKGITYISGGQRIPARSVQQQKIVGIIDRGQEAVIRRPGELIRLGIDLLGKHLAVIVRDIPGHNGAINAQERDVLAIRGPDQSLCLYVKRDCCETLARMGIPYLEGTTSKKRVHFC